VVAPHFNAIAFAVGAFERLAVLVARQFLGVPRQYCVHDLDGLEVAQDGFGRGAAAGAEMPLQIADPEHELSDRRSARVDLQPKE
jgi:hypothetical protein